MRVRVKALNWRNSPTLAEHDDFSYSYSYFTTLHQAVHCRTVCRSCLLVHPQNRMPFKINAYMVLLSCTSISLYIWFTVTTFNLFALLCHISSSPNTFWKTLDSVSSSSLSVSTTTSALSASVSFALLKTACLSHCHCQSSQHLIAFIILPYPHCQSLPPTPYLILSSIV